MQKAGTAVCLQRMKRGAEELALRVAMAAQAARRSARDGERRCTSCMRRGSRWPSRVQNKNPALAEKKRVSNGSNVSCNARHKQEHSPAAATYPDPLGAMSTIDSSTCQESKCGAERCNCGDLITVPVNNEWLDDAGAGASRYLRAMCSVRWLRRCS